MKRVPVKTPLNAFFLSAKMRLDYCFLNKNPNNGGVRCDVNFSGVNIVPILGKSLCTNYWGRLLPLCLYVRVKDD
jgi:hypothetical protein